MDRTTDLGKLKNGKPFTWGEIVAIHEIGNLSVVEYHPWKKDGVTICTGDADMESLQFHGYIDGKSVSESWNTLDRALVGLICQKHDGYSSRAAYYIFKMIGA